MNSLDEHPLAKVSLAKRSLWPKCHSGQSVIQPGHDVTCMFNIIGVIRVVPVVNIQSLHDVLSVDIPSGPLGYKRPDNNNKSSVAFCTPNNPEVINNNKL
jgi:hypothetical protein